MYKIITKHLERKHLKIPVDPLPSGSICAFSGLPITEGVALKKLIKKTFTDHELIRYKSDHAGVQIAMLMEAVIPGEKQLNSLRNYSFYASEREFRLLKRTEMLEFMQNIPDDKFYICLTFSNKKHIAYKATLNLCRYHYTVTTDRGNFDFHQKVLDRFLPIMKKWYGVIPGKEGAKIPPTYFNKAQIAGAQPSQKQIDAYGRTRYFIENAELNSFRGGLFFETILWMLKKTFNHEN